MMEPSCFFISTDLSFSLLPPAQVACWLLHCSVSASMQQKGISSLSHAGLGGGSQHFSSSRYHPTLTSTIQICRSVPQSNVPP